MGNLSKLKNLWVGNNQLSGAPKSLSQLRYTSTSIVLFPNPMSTIPYDLFSITPAAVMSSTNWTNFLNVSPLIKRQLTSSMSAEELYQLCPLNNVKRKEVVAGCITGIYNKLCKNKSDLRACQSTYDNIVAGSYFKPLGVCAAWKFGPWSLDCRAAIESFSFKDSQITLTSANANDFVTSIFKSQVYAPCVSTGTVTCNWN